MAETSVHFAEDVLAAKPTGERRDGRRCLFERENLLDFRVVVVHELARPLIGRNYDIRPARMIKPVVAVDDLARVFLPPGRGYHNRISVDRPGAERAAFNSQTGEAGFLRRAGDLADDPAIGLVAR